METQAGDRAFRAVGASGSLEPREATDVGEGQSLLLTGVSVTRGGHGFHPWDSNAFTWLRRGGESEGEGHGEAASATKRSRRS